MQRVKLKADEFPSVLPPVHRIDFITGACQNCGATRSEIDDNLAPECVRGRGVHRLALSVLKRQQQRYQMDIGESQRRLVAVDAQRATMLADIARYEEALSSIDDSITALNTSVPASLTNTH